MTPAWNQKCGQKWVSVGPSFRAKDIEKIPVDFGRVFGNEPFVVSSKVVRKKSCSQQIFFKRCKRIFSFSHFLKQLLGGVHTI